MEESLPAAKRARVADGEASGEPPEGVAPALHLALLDSCFVNQHDQVVHPQLSILADSPTNPIEPLAIAAHLDCW